MPFYDPSSSSSLIQVLEKVGTRTKSAGSRSHGHHLRSLLWEDMSSLFVSNKTSPSIVGDFFRTQVSQIHASPTVFFFTTLFVCPKYLSYVICCSYAKALYLDSVSLAPDASLPEQNKQFEHNRDILNDKILLLQLSLKWYSGTYNTAVRVTTFSWT